MLRSRSTSVLLFSDWGTFRYSHDLLAKKKAPPPNCPIALLVSVILSFNNSRKTQTGTAFCWTGLGSLFRKALNCLDRSHPSSPSSSFVGFGLSFFPEGRCHKRDGISECALSQGVISWSQKPPSTHSHGKCSDEADSLTS